MNKVNCSTFHAKLQELLPNLPQSITPEVLGKLCEDDSIQPFLKWFCVNVKVDNVLTDECTKLKEHIQKNDVWLEGKNLDAALEEVTKDCPELLKLIESNYWNNNQSSIDFNTEKDLYEADLEYLQELECSIKKLKSQEEELDKKIEIETDTLKEKKVKVTYIYENCLSVMEELDSSFRQFSNAVELLSNSYIDALQKKGEPCLWTQMPIELYIKQLQTYNDYLISYTKRQFPMPKTDETTENNKDYARFINEHGENDKLKELLFCQQNIFTSKMNEIISKAEDEANKALLGYVTEIYNDGDLKAPSTAVLARAEVADLTKTRDFLEESINNMQEVRLVNAVEQYSRARIFKVYEEEAKTRIERKTNRLFRLERLCTFAKEHGHAFSTLLCMLFELQIHRINEIISFVIDARHYLSKEYNLSTSRTESMQKLQNEFASITNSPKEQNKFCRLFTEMTSIMDSKNDFQESIQYYNDLKNDNDEKLKILLDEKLVQMIESSEELEKKVMELFQNEISKSPTLSFTALPCEIQDELDNTVEKVKSIETNVESMRNKLKNMIKETNEPSFNREKLLIWQKFVANPESLKERFEELKDVENHITFKNSVIS